VPSEDKVPNLDESESWDGEGSSAGQESSPLLASSGLLLEIESDWVGTEVSAWIVGEEFSGLENSGGHEFPSSSSAPSGRVSEEPTPSVVDSVDFEGRAASDGVDSPHESAVQSTGVMAHDFGPGATASVGDGDASEEPISIKAISIKAECFLSEFKSLDL
jgi:hypothetical protein